MQGSRWQKTLKKLFPDREIHIRSNGKIIFHKLSSKLQVIALIGVFSILGWTAFSTWSVGYFKVVISEKDRHISNARLAYHSLLGDVAEYQKKFAAVTQDLEKNHAMMLGLVKKNDSLQYELNNVSKRLVSTETERESEQKAREILKSNLSQIKSQLRLAANKNFSLEDNLSKVEKNLQKALDDRNSVERAREVLKGNLSQIETQLRDAATRNFSLEDNLTMVENDLQKALSDRNQALFESTGLRQKINVLENKITNLQSVQDESIQNINNLLDDSISLFTGIIDSTGIKLSRLIGKQKIAKKVGIGGPFIPAQSDLSPGEKMRQDLILLNDKIRMWDNLKGFLKQLPLISPVNSHYISSGFGKRRDPFNKRWAAHYGIDLVSHFKAPVYSTAAGKVSYVGRKGRYGRLIEIKHGAGFKTRYGHLHKIYVKRGENIRPYQKIGLLGNSGRSTGPHLHYEVIFKGKPMNPRNFIKAGYYVFKNKW